MFLYYFIFTIFIMSNFSISFQDINSQYDQTGNFNFKHPHSESLINITFEDCKSDVDRFIKVNKIIKLYNKKMCLIKDETTSETIKSTHSNSNYYKNILSIKKYLNK